jgi:hypothetical protein
MTKICKNCGKEKNIEEFDKSRAICKDCRREYENLYSAKRRKDFSQRTNIEVPESFTCYTCKKEKPTNQFYKDKGYITGLSKRCRDCVKKYLSTRDKKIREKNMETGIDLTGTKRCTKCGNVFTKDVFYKDLGKPDGLTAWCRFCFAANNKKDKLL